MKDLKKIWNFIVLVVWAFATIGSSGYLFYNGVPQFGIANLCLSAMAFPYMKKNFLDLLYN